MPDYPHSRARAAMIAAYAEAILDGPGAAVASCVAALEAVPDAQESVVTGVAAVVLAAAPPVEAAAGAVRDQLRAALRDHPDLPTAAASHVVASLGWDWPALTARSGETAATPASLRDRVLALARRLL
jgi:hypothetical protein